MPKIEAAIKEAILRGARREIRLATHSLRRDVRRLRRHVGQVRTSVTSFRAVASQWQRATQVDGWKPQVSEEELKIARLSPGLIQKLRARLRLSQAGLARLLNVTAAAVISWERGRSEPSEPNRKGLVALRKLGRRDVKRLLTALPTRSAKGRSTTRRRRGGRNTKVSRGSRLRRGRRRSP